MAIKDFPRRLLGALKGVNYRLGGTSLMEMAIPPGWNYQQYLSAYGEVGWLFGSVSLISNSVADSNWMLYANSSKTEKKEIDDHPMLDLLNQINPFQTRYQFFLLAQMYIGLVGECFIVLDFNRLGVPGRMWLAPPGYMYVVPDKENYISHYEYRKGGQVQRLEIPEVIHVMDPNPANPYRGMGAAHSIGTDLDSERYASRYQQKLFFNDARPGMALEIPGDIPPKEERDDFMKQWNSQYRGWGKAYSTAFLWGGMKINNVTMTNRDMDFKELRGATRNIILAAYHIPESLIGASEVGSRARAEADEYIFAKYTIKPALQRFKEALNEQLCPLFDEKLELGFVNPVPEDRATLVDECDKLVRAGVYTREFAQGLLGHSPQDMKGGTYLMPMAIIPETAKQVGTLQIKTPTDWEDEYSGELPHWARDLTPSLFAQEYSEEMRRHKVKNVLEIGCGNGRDAIFFARAGFEVTAIDLVPRAVELARENATEAEVNIDFRVANAEELPFPDTAFGAVFSLSVLHSTNLKLSLPEIKRVIRSKGIAFLYLYSDTQFASGAKEEYISVDEFLEALKMLGFDLLDFYSEQEDNFDEFGEKHRILVTLLQKG